ncbi:MAG TPA: response regulator [Sandaracinaceae bacterium]
MSAFEPHEPDREDTDLPEGWDPDGRAATGEIRVDERTLTGTMLPSPRGRAAARLIVLSGHHTGMRYPLVGGAVVLGRSDDCDLQLDDPKVSRVHARLVRQGEQWLIEDLGSRNGTLVNGERLTERRALSFGDRVQLSPDTMLVFAREDPLEDRLLHRQKMEVIGQLAAGIAHDFNNLLNVIAAGVAHLGGLPPGTTLGDPDVRECVEDVRAAAKRASELTARLLTIARREDGGRAKPRQRVNVSALGEEVLALVRRTFDRRIRIASRIEPGLTVVGDYAALHQALMNLCINARDAMPSGGQLTLTVEPVRDPDTGSNVREIAVVVKDTGVGMDEPTLARVFEPFFTTKAKGTGSGLGLATVYEVVTSHGGVIEVESNRGEGSTFTLMLPAAPAESAGPPARARRPATATADELPRRGRPARVLIVDDEELVRRSLGRLVRAAGYEVLFAADGAQALRVYAADRRPDVVLLDLDMPNLSGAETLARLKRMDPGARVVLVSGYYDENRKRHLLARGALDFIAKPVEPGRLRDSIRTALEVPAGG